MAGKRKGGPVPLIDAEKVRSIVRDLGAGVPRKFAAERAGISESCLYKWLAKGRKGGKKIAAYVQLLQDLKKAEAEALAASVARIRKAAQGGQVVERTTTTTRPDGTTTTKTVVKVSRGEWTADAWFLERRHPDEFATNRREVKELREQLAALLKLVADGKIGGTPEEGPATPRVGGDADPEAI